MPLVGKALEVTAPGKFRIIEVEAPAPKPDEILVEVKACATCTNWELQTWRGTDIFERPGYPIYPQNPGSPGHEAAGIVLEVGSEVTGITPGDHVAVYGSLRGPENDAHAQHIVREASQVTLVAPQIPFERAAPLEMALCAVRSLDLGQPLEGRSLCVVGLGPAGILHLQVARACGATPIIGVDVVEARLEAARPFADRVIHAGDEAAIAELRTGGVERAYDCSGSGPGMALALDAARLALHVFSVPHDTVAWGPTQWFRGVSILPYHWRGSTQVDCLRRAARMLEAGQLDTGAIVTKVLPYTRYDEGLALLQSREAIKVVFAGWE